LVHIPLSLEEILVRLSQVKASYPASNASFYFVG